MSFSIRNHYNPCFWTAFWNNDFYETSLLQKSKSNNPRKQVVYSLNLRANKIIKTIVEDVHFDKNLATAEITPEAVKNFCKRNFPDEYEQFSSDVEKDSETLYLDFEQTLAGIERTPPYQTLIEVIKKEKIEHAQEKIFIACFLVIHGLRCHAIMNSMIEFHKTMGLEKFEYFWFLKHMLGNTNSLYKLVIPFVMSHWTIYRTNKHNFPLNDSPLLHRPDSIMIALSPRMLLEINRLVRSDESQWLLKDSISASKMNEFRKRTILNTFREIIFPYKDLLEKWSRTKEYKKRVSLLSKTNSYNEILENQLGRELWIINAYSNAL